MPRISEDCSSAFCPQYELLQVRSGFRQLASTFRSPACISFLFLLVLTNSFSSRAQSASATLGGTVTDQAGAVVPNVNIAVINIEQGFQRSTKTDDEGSFVVPLLPPGNYVVKAEREGFTTSELPNVILNVNDRISISIQLKVGSLPRSNSEYCRESDPDRRVTRYGNSGGPSIRRQSAAQWTQLSGFDDSFTGGCEHEIDQSRTRTI